MKYYCKINKIVDELEVVLDISGNLIKGFDIHGTLLNEGDECFVEMSFFDDIIITESKEKKPAIYSETGFKYSFIGKLDIGKRCLESLINIELDEAELYEYSYLDEKFVKVDVKRIDFVFLDG